jgi:superfamily I DNA and/or RNA helicase
VRIELCTVDRFQGHEADVVFLSIANQRVTNFLESVNRMNVALTRARYQRVVVGNRLRLRRREGTLLHELATNEPWEIAFRGAQ